MRPMTCVKLDVKTTDMDDSYENIGIYVENSYEVVEVVMKILRLLIDRMIL